MKVCTVRSGLCEFCQIFLVIYWRQLSAVIWKLWGACCKSSFFKSRCSLCVPISSYSKLCPCILNFLHTTCTSASILALGSTHPPIQWVLGILPQGCSGQGMKLTSHLHLVPRFRVCGATPTFTPQLHLHGMVFSYAQWQLYLYLTILRTCVASPSILNKDLWL
jgi:hypothetical protein